MQVPRPPFWLTGMLCLSLLSCVVPEKASPFAGSWHGKVLHKKTFVAPGLGTAGSDTYEELKGLIWNVNTCTGGLAVELYAGCNFRAIDAGDTAPLEVGSWCDIPQTDGSTLRMSVLSGALQLVNGKVEGTVRMALHQMPSPTGVYMEYTDTLSDTQSSLVADSGNCAARSGSSVPAHDFSALAGCAEIADRSDPGADRTVAVVAGVLTPACMQIAIGQKVAIQSVPWKLDRGVPGQPNAGTEGNPIPTLSMADPTLVTFLRPGDYLYYATEGAKSKGLIRVR